jgi:alpha-N-acetylglucosamine transferase
MALRSKKLVFTQAEFEKFGFLDLPINVYIRVDDQYFKPAVTADWNKRFEATVDVYWNNLVRYALLS